MKILPAVFLHACDGPLAVGTRIEPDGIGTSFNPVVEEIFEAMRPSKAISRADAVHLAADREALDRIGTSGGGFVCGVEPVGEVQRRDVAWLETACRAVEREIHERDWRPAVERCAKRYWAGRSEDDAVYVFLVRAAVVVGQSRTG